MVCVEGVMAVRNAPGGGIQALIRWSGEHEDQWRTLGSFGGSARCGGRKEGASSVCMWPAGPGGALVQT